MILQIQSIARDMDNSYFPGKDRPGNNATLRNWQLELQITAFRLRLHLGLADAHQARLARLAALSPTRVGELVKPPVCFLRKAGYGPREQFFLLYLGSFCESPAANLS